MSTFQNSKYPQKRRVYKKPEPRDPDIPLTDAEREKLKRRAFNVSYWHLGRSDKTRQEIYLKLKAKDIPADIIEATLESLESDNYLNDKRYTENFTRSKQEYQKMGKRAIGFELKRKGVDSDIISEVLSDVDEDTEYENAKKLVRSKLRSSKDLDAQKRTNRMVSMLARKGYSAGMAFKVVKEVFEEEKLEMAEDEDNFI
jgi:regulatory protein